MKKDFAIKNVQIQITIFKILLYFVNKKLDEKLDEKIDEKIDKLTVKNTF